MTGVAEVKASPSVRKAAADRGIDIDRLAKDLGRTTIGKEDLDASRPVVTVPGGDPSFWRVDHSEYGPVTEQATSRFDRIAAKKLGAAQTVIPSVTHHDRADVTAIETLRKRWKKEAGQRGVRLTALAFHVKALSRCLRTFPSFNASLSADGETLILKDYVHIGIAVDTDHGLMVPVIRNADRKGLWQIATEIADLAARAQVRKVAADEMGGASMSISNLGSIGGISFTPIVNPPEVAILGITRTDMTPVWDGETFRPKPMVPLDLTYDHRVINGADAARFLAHFTGLIAEPRRLLL